MKIIWNSRYKSIDTLMVEAEDLPDFTLLSGLNGTGKTHLLEGIADSSNENCLEIETTNAKTQYYNSPIWKYVSGSQCACMVTPILLA